MGIRVENSGDFDNIKSFYDKITRGEIYEDLDQYGELGKESLSKHTPVRTGLAAQSWSFEIEEEASNRVSIHWTNLDVEGGLEVVILLQYGHATGTGGYVSGKDFINPAMEPVFEAAIEAYREKVNNA